MDEALRNPNARRKKKGGDIVGSSGRFRICIDIDIVMLQDLEMMGDTEVDNVRSRMAKAAEMDTEARTAGQTAMHKLKMLPEVVALLHRNQFQNQLVDPDINLLESVRFFLEPLNDGSLPAYNIQRELFAALAKLPITKETLVASGIGKVVMFYTRSSRTEALIKRQAEKLLSEWMRPILNRTDDYRQRTIATADYDPTYVLPPFHLCRCTN
jgi:transcription factor SPN1